MKKAHLYYLKKAINIAINMKNIADVPNQINQLRSYRPPIYRLIRDVVSDRRFYGVTEDTAFWHRYTLATVYNFIELLSDEDLSSPEMLEIKKEDFLDSWYLKNSVPLSPEKEMEIELDLQKSGWSSPVSKEYKYRDLEELYMGYNFDPRYTDITDCTYPRLDPCIIKRTGAENQQSYPSIFNNAIYAKLPSEIKDYIFRVEECEKCNDTEIEMEPRIVEAKFLNSIDPTLRRLAKMIGRGGGEFYSDTRGKFQHSKRSDITGITVGNDLSSLLPTELALLGHQSTELLFYNRYAHKRLQVFSSSSISKEQSFKKKGAIFMCIDTSGSMFGEPELMTKSLCLAIAIIAQRERRPLCVVNYSDSVSFFILKNIERQRKEFLRFLAHSYSGGNNETKLFDFLFRILPNSPYYSKFSGYFKNADLLVISDFFWSSVDKSIIQLIGDVHKGGMKFYSLGVNYDEIAYAQKEDKNDPLSFGSYFFNSSDYRFLYLNGRVEECISQNKIRQS